MATEWQKRLQPEQAIVDSSFTIAQVGCAIDGAVMYQTFTG